MIVRPAEPGDAEAIAVVHVRTWQDAYRGLMPQDHLDALSVEARRVLWARILTAAADAAGPPDGPRSGTFVALDGARVVGFTDVGPSRDAEAPADADATTEATPDVGEVNALYVLASAWGTGTGRALMAAAEGALRAARFTEATLWVLESNARARRFYEAAGWAVDGTARTQELRGVPLPEVRYRRALAGPTLAGPVLAGPTPRRHP